MNPVTSHQELKDLIPAAALEILEDAEAREVFAHLQGCPECARLLHEYRQAAATLPELLPGHPLDPERSAAIRARLMHRVHAQHAPPISDIGGVRPAASARPRVHRWSAWTGWAVAAGLAGVLLVHHAVHRPLAYGWLAAGVLMLLLLALGVYARLQRGRAAALEQRLAALERQGSLRDNEIEP